MAQNLFASSGIEGSATGDGTFVAGLAMYALIALSFVGLRPFSGDTLAAVNSLATSGEGDLARQVGYTAVFLTLSFLGARRKGLQGLIVLPMALGLTLGWCLISALWSVAPETTVRRGVLTAMVVLSVFIAWDLLGTERGVTILYRALALIVIVDIVSILIVPEATHLAVDSTADVVGAWRGLHGHKNSAGAIAAAAVLVFFHFAMKQGRAIDWCLLLVSCVFLIGTQSKTAMIASLVAVLASAAYRSAASNNAVRFGLRVAIVGSVLSLIFGLLLFQDEIAELLSDPAILTGRGAIWQIQFAYLQDNFWLGSGFGAFWNSGDNSPVRGLTDVASILNYKQSHNGYLQVLVETGVIGFSLAILSTAIVTLFRILSGSAMGDSENALTFSLFVLFLVINGAETTLFRQDAPGWIAMLVALAILYQRSPGNLSAKSGLPTGQQPHHGR